MTCLDLQAKLWVQVIRQLRNGVKLKAIGVGESARKPIEYELTPYEMMMDDIRSRRYKLRQVMVDGAIPPRVKKDAHAVILEFIRSRPPLRKVNSNQQLIKSPLPLLNNNRRQIYLFSLVSFPFFLLSLSLIIFSFLKFKK